MSSPFKDAICDQDIEKGEKSKLKVDIMGDNNNNNLDELDKSDESDGSDESEEIDKDQIDILLQTIKSDFNSNLKELKIELKEEINNQTPRSNFSLDDELEYDGKQKKRRKKFDTLVYDEDYEEKNETILKNGIKVEKWSKHKKHRLHKCLWKLKYNRIVSSFYLDDLRRREERWSWLIIVISTITSGMTVANNVQDEPFKDYNTLINISLTISSMSTSLIAAWIKKQKFVEKINEVDKYLLNINVLCEELEIQFSLLESDRLDYEEFKKKYIPEITKYLTTNPLIPPHEWKNCVREITLKYPELVDPDNSENNKLWPWFGDLVKYTDEKGETHDVRKPTTFMRHMKKTNKDKILSSCCHKHKECDNVYK